MAQAQLSFFFLFFENLWDVVARFIREHADVINVSPVPPPLPPRPYSSTHTVWFQLCLHLWPFHGHMTKGPQDNKLYLQNSESLSVCVVFFVLASSKHRKTTQNYKHWSTHKVCRFSSLNDNTVITITTLAFFPLSKHFVQIFFLFFSQLTE